MKKVFFILCMVISFAYGQTYSPALHTVTNKALGIAQANPTDARSYYYDPSLFLYRPYQSTSEVLAYLNLSKYRTGQFSIIINSGGTLNPDGTFSGGTFNEYWFKDGVTNSDLVIKAAVVTTDTASWNTAYRKRPISLAYDSTTNIISLTLGDGSILFDTLSTLNPVVLYNGSSTVGDSLLVSSISGDTAWVKNLLIGNGLIGVNMGDTVLKINSDSSTAFNIYNSDGRTNGERTVSLDTTENFTIDGGTFNYHAYLQIAPILPSMSFKMEKHNSWSDMSAGILADNAGFTPYPLLNLQAAGGLFLTHNDYGSIGSGGVLAADTVMPYYGVSDTLMYWNPSTGQVMRAKVLGGGGSGTVTSVGAGYGTAFPTITTSGSVEVDTAQMATRARVQKAIDSINAFQYAAGSTGAVQFNESNILSADNSNFFWDNTNNYLGIGNAAPGARLTVTDNSLGVATTEVDGVTLENNTAATVGAQERSPHLRFVGQGWKTNATAGSQQVEFRNYLLPVQSSVSPSYSLNWEYQINNGTRYTPLMLNSGGLNVAGAAGAAGGISLGNAFPGANSITGTTSLSFLLSSTPAAVSFNFGSGSTATSGTYRMFALDPGTSQFAPTSGTATYEYLFVKPRVNQTGGANGITRGIYIDVDNTAAADFRALEADTGRVVFNGGFHLRSQPAAVTSANYTVGIDENFIYLPDLTTEAVGRNVVMPTPTIMGRLLYVFNINSDATYKWTFTGTTVEDAAGVAVTTLTDQKCYTLYFYGTTWKVLSVQ